MRPSPFDAVAFFVPLLVYAFSISPWPQSWDYGEMQTVPYILGIPHPTGFPAFVLLGWLFSHALPIETVAWRVDFLCALFVAGATLTVRQLALALGATGWASLAAAFAFAFTEVAWEKAAHADVHAVATLFSVLVLLAAADYANTRRASSLRWGALAYGLGLATHPNVLWSGIALGFGLGFETLHDVRKGAAIAALALLPLALYAYLPIRSAIVESAHLDPGENPPFDGHGELDWDTNQPRTPSGFLVEVSGSQFSAASSLKSIFNVRLYPAYASQWLTASAKQIGLPAIGLGIAGAVAGIAGGGRRREATLCVLAGGFAAVPFAYSYGAELDLSRYLLPSLAATAALAGAASAIGKRRTGLAGLAVALALFGGAWFFYQANAGEYDERNNPGGQGTIDGVRRDVPDGALVLSDWIDSTALAYAAYVDRSLGRRVVLSWSEQNAPLYPHWTASTRVFVLANFVIKKEVERSIAPACLKSIPAAGLSDESLYEIRCPARAAAR